MPSEKLESVQIQIRFSFDCHPAGARVLIAWIALNHKLTALPQFRVYRLTAFFDSSSATFISGTIFQLLGVCQPLKSILV